MASYARTLSIYKTMRRNRRPMVRIPRKRIRAALMSIWTDGGTFRGNPEVERLYREWYANQELTDSPINPDVVVCWACNVIDESAD